MTGWFRLDCDVYDHPKILSVPKAARWVWVAGLAYSARNRRDGYVPPQGLRAVDGSARDAGALVLAGLWLPEPGGGWRIHHYDEYQPVNGELSKKRSEAGRKGAMARWHSP